MENRIRELRQKNHMSQIRLSIELEVSQETVSAYENGKHYPSFETLLKLSKIFNSSIDYLMGLSEKNILSQDIRDDEIELLNIFRSLNSDGKELTMVYLKSLAQYLKDKKK